MSLDADISEAIDTRYPATVLIHQSACIYFTSWLKIYSTAACIDLPANESANNLSNYALHDGGEFGRRKKYCLLVHIQTNETGHEYTDQTLDNLARFICCNNPKSPPHAKSPH